MEKYIPNFILYYIDNIIYARILSFLEKEVTLTHYRYILNYLL